MGSPATRRATRRSRAASRIAPPDSTCSRRVSGARARGGAGAPPGEGRAPPPIPGGLEDRVPRLDLLPPEDADLLAQEGLEAPGAHADEGRRVELREEDVAGAGLLEPPDGDPLLVVETQTDEPKLPHRRGQARGAARTLAQNRRASATRTPNVPRAMRVI